MPGCCLRVAGTRFDVDAFLASATLEPTKIWRLNEPLVEGVDRAPKQEWSGILCNVSNVDGDLDGQIQDAIEFLNAHRDDLETLANDASVEDRRLDFGFDCRLGDDVVMQGEWLPVDFLKLVGELNIGVALSLYPPLLT